MASLIRLWAFYCMVLVSAGLLTSTQVNAADDSGGSGNFIRSNRLIVELEDPPLALDPSTKAYLIRQRGKSLNRTNSGFASRVKDLRATQDKVLEKMGVMVPEVRRARFKGGKGGSRELSYVMAFNGFAVEADAEISPELLRARLAALPGVKTIYYDHGYSPSLFTSLPHIQVPTAWAQIAGGSAHAGAGVKIGSMDGGIHHQAPMFSGIGYAYPEDYPLGGLGETANNNGKIIASRSYFRDWDPPVAGDEFPWPGPAGTSHGVHTSGIMAGNPVNVSYHDGSSYAISGVAPAAWVMSYKVFYGSVGENPRVYSAEALAALEDILADGAEILNNSWGGGAYQQDDFDPVGKALRNLAAAGTFISFSAGNEGPERGTADHPGSEYMTVASVSTETGGFSAGQISIDMSGGPKGIPYSGAQFGASWPLIPAVMEYTTAMIIAPDNTYGCSAWPEGALEGKCLLIERGVCEFSAKAYEAQQAGAIAVIVFNHQTGGDTLVEMGAGAVGDSVTIPAAFIGHADGLALVEWISDHPGAQLSIHAGDRLRISGTPDIIAESSSRGPGIGNVLKPDIAAPGVNVLSQGYGSAAGEEKHLGFGPASGTSMASPHVAGAAALLRQLYPDWSNADIKSAMMNTARFLDIYTDSARTQLAQPLDMGAGCLDLERAIDPGLLLNPPSLSFGQVQAGELSAPIVVRARNVGTAAESYVLESIVTTGGPGNISGWDALEFTPASFTVNPGEEAAITVTLNTAAASVGDLQGFLLLSGDVHQVHLPAWGAVAAQQAKDVLLLDFDASSAENGPADYRDWYTNTMDDLEWTYDVLDVLQNEVPPVVELMAYRALILFTGDNGVANNQMLSPGDVWRLVEFTNQGGLLVIMGQACSKTIPEADSAFGLYHVIDSVTGGAQPVSLIVPANAAPLPAGFALDPRQMGDGAGNQTNMNVIDMQWDRDYIDYYPFVRWLEYEGQLVAFAHRDQPVLGRAGTSIPARFIVASFGLEGLNDRNSAAASRRAWLQRIWDWGFDEPVASLAVTPLGNRRFRLTASLSDPKRTVVRTRFSFGDGTYATSTHGSIDHTYADLGEYSPQVEILNDLGNRAVASTVVNQIQPPSSDIRIESIAVNAAGAVTLRFASEPGKTYFIEYTDDLTDEFIRIESGVTATSALTEFTDPGPPLTPAPLAIAGQRFYRIVEE